MKNHISEGKLREAVRFLLKHQHDPEAKEILNEIKIIKKESDEMPERRDYQLVQ
ncbi:MAG TPA: hypothetical protein VNM69_06500 [Bacillus sp. (in: firmicutes)]|nr:hypothetical protein [Bacillus sp. (in: firmicutes)]